MLIKDQSEKEVGECLCVCVCVHACVTDEKKLDTTNTVQQIFPGQLKQ